MFSFLVQLSEMLLIANVEQLANELSDCHSWPITLIVVCGPRILGQTLLSHGKIGQTHALNIIKAGFRRLHGLSTNTCKTRCNYLPEAGSVAPP